MKAIKRKFRESFSTPKKKAVEAICSGCGKAFVDGLSFVPCLHGLCGDCIERGQAIKTCPDCAEEIVAAIKNESLNKILEKIKPNISPIIPSQIRFKYFHQTEKILPYKNDTVSVGITEKNILKVACVCCKSTKNIQSLCEFVPSGSLCSVICGRFYDEGAHFEWQVREAWNDILDSRSLLLNRVFVKNKELVVQSKYRLFCEECFLELFSVLCNKYFASSDYNLDSSSENSSSNSFSL